MSSALANWLSTAGGTMVKVIFSSCIWARNTGGSNGWCSTSEQPCTAIGKKNPPSAAMLTSGKGLSRRSPGRYWPASALLRPVASHMLCDRGTPLGVPVVPDVQHTVSVALASAGWRCRCCSTFLRLSACGCGSSCRLRNPGGGLSPAADPNTSTGTEPANSLCATSASRSFLTRSTVIIAAGESAAAAMPSSCAPYCTGRGDTIAPIMLAA